VVLQDGSKFKYSARRKIQEDSSLQQPARTQTFTERTTFSENFMSEQGTGDGDISKYNTEAFYFN
jgi:hypothetical protein